MISRSHGEAGLEGRSPGGHVAQPGRIIPMQAPCALHSAGYPRPGGGGKDPGASRPAPPLAPAGLGPEQARTLQAVALGSGSRGCLACPWGPAREIHPVCLRAAAAAMPPTPRDCEAMPRAPEPRRGIPGAAPSGHVPGAKGQWGPPSVTAPSPPAA